MGYSTVWRPVVYGAPSVTPRGSSPNISDPTFPLDSTLDPRGVFPSGMLPSKAFSYRFYQSFDDQTTSDSMTDILNSFEQLTGSMGAPSLVFASVLPSVVFSHHTLYDAVTIFEGRDVIDLPTDDLKYEDNVLYVPSKVFRPLFAGDDKFLKDGESLSRESIIQFSQPTSDNLFVAMKLSDGAPEDVKRLALGGADRRLVDVLSNGIICRSKPKYISYVAVDNVLFRDVIVLAGGSQAIGVASPGLGGFRITDASPSGTWRTKAYRFALVNLSKDKDVSLPAWRLSETFGVKPAKIVEAPPALVSSSPTADKIRNAADHNVLHYAYDLNEEGADPTFFDFNVGKTGYSPLLAKSSTQSSSKYYDKTKSFKVIDYELDYAAGGGITETLGVGIGSNEKGVHVDAMYTSPRWSQSITTAARMGTEYMAYRPYGTSVIIPTFGPSQKNTSIVLASTTTVATGMAAVNDCCLYACTLFDMFSSPAGDMMVERSFDDLFWKRRAEGNPESTLGEYLVGEVPSRSGGSPSSMPRQVQLQATITPDKNVTMPSEKFATALLVRLSSSSNSNLTLFPNSNGEGDALFEMSFGDTTTLEGQADAYVLVNVPGLVFRSYTSNAIEITQIFGVGRRDPMLPDMIAPGPKESDPLDELRKASKIQLSYVKAESFPVESKGLTADTDCTEGRIYVAYENKGRIDMAVRYGCSPTPFFIARDVTLRAVSVTEQAKAALDAPKATADSGTPFPSASVPFLVEDDATKTIFLFFLYKGKICAKRCPKEIFNGMALPCPDEPSTWKTSKDGDASQSMHELGADMAYDGVTQDQGKSKANDASRDITLGSLRAPEPNTTTKDSSGQPVTQYCAFLSKKGQLFVFIQAEKANPIRRSANSGKTWSDAVPGDFSFIPALTTTTDATTTTVATKEQEESQPAVAESPYCLYDDALDAITIFFTFRQSLMYVKLPVETLMKESTDAVALGMTKEIKPRVLFGRYTTEMFKRGITPARIENVDRGASAPIIPAQRVAAVKTVEGYYRIFFKDESQKLYSLISKDAGESWWWPEAPVQETTSGQ